MISDSIPPAGRARLIVRRLAVVAVAVLLPSASFASGPASPLAAGRTLSLEEATRLALARNHDVAFERQSFRIAAESLARSAGSYDPTLRLDGKWRKRTDPQNSIFLGAPAGEDAPTVESLGLQAGLQQLFATGGTVSLSASLSRETTNGLYSPISPSYPLLLGVDLRQPLLQNRSIDPARRAIHVARIDRDRSAASLKRSVTETVASVERAYWTLVAAQRDVTVQGGAVALAGEQLLDTRARIEAGTLPESDLAQPRAELERRKGELLNATESSQRAENQLKSLIAGGDTDPVWDESLVAADPPEAPVFPVDLPSALRQAATLRPELQEAALRVTRQEVEVESARDRVRPQLDLIAGYSRRGLAGGTNPDATNPFAPGAVTIPPQFEGSVGRSWGTVTENRFPDASVGLSLTVPVGNRAALADRAIAEAEREQARISLAQAAERVAVEVRNAAVSLRTAVQRIEAARAGREAAETQLMAEKERFSVGLSTNFFVLTRQNDLARAMLTETAALTDYRKAAAELARAVGSLLDDRKISVTEGASR
jgi:outer membrane protein TolC